MRGKNGPRMIAAVHMEHSRLQRHSLTLSWFWKLVATNLSSAAFTCLDFHSLSIVAQGSIVPRSHAGGLSQTWPRPISTEYTEVNPHIRRKVLRQARVIAAMQTTSKPIIPVATAMMRLCSGLDRTHRLRVHMTGQSNS